MGGGGFLGAQPIISWRKLLAHETRGWGGGCGLEASSIPLAGPESAETLPRGMVCGGGGMWALPRTPMQPPETLQANCAGPRGQV